MEQTAYRLEREVWPVANARQFVLTFPLQVRRWLSSSPDLMSDVILNVTNVIKEFYEGGTLRGSDADQASMPTNGSITFVQLFGSALNLNPHIHMIFLDGVFAQTPTGKRFYPYDQFGSDCVIGILVGIYHRLDHLFRRLGYVKDDGEAEENVAQDDVPLPFKPRAPKAYRRMCRNRDGVPPHPLYQQTDPNLVSVEGWCNVRWKWFSLHAGVAIKGEDRQGLKRLFRYTSRSSISPSRLSYVDSEEPETSEVALALKRPWSDGSTSLCFKQVDFLERVLSIIPAPWWNLVRYQGLFAPGHTWRASVVPGPQVKRHACGANDPPPTGKPSAGRVIAERQIPWAELLRRTYGVDPEICECGAKMKVEDVITDGETIAQVMLEMGLARAPPPRGRKPRLRGELDMVYEYDGDDGV